MILYLLYKAYQCFATIFFLVVLVRLIYAKKKFGDHPFTFDAYPHFMSCCWYSKKRNMANLPWYTYRKTIFVLLFTLFYPDYQKYKYPNGIVVLNRKTMSNITIYKIVLLLGILHTLSTAYISYESQQYNDNSTIIKSGYIDSMRIIPPTEPIPYRSHDPDTLTCTNDIYLNDINKLLNKSIWY